MAYRFLMVNTDYGEFLEKFYRDNPGLWARSFDEQHAAKTQMHFGVNDYYSSNLQKLGHQAIDLRYDNRFMQYAWVVENGLMPRRGEHDEDFIRSLPDDWLAAVFQAQIKMYKPDVIVDMAMNPVTWKVLNLVKPDVPLIIGQYGSPVFHEMEKLSVYDMFISACHKYVDRFHKAGKVCEYFKLGFGSAILDSIDTRSDRPIDVAFVGGFTHHHTKGTDLINYLAAQGISMALYGYGKDSLSPLAQRYFRGELFGKDMLDLYSKAKIVINRHTNIANSVGNMRLYEATGMGACLLTDDMKNLELLFAPGKEVAVYRSPEECAKLIRYYLAHEDERKQIALNGQRRTLSEHTYYHRMTKLADIADNYLQKNRSNIRGPITVQDVKPVAESEKQRSQDNHDGELLQKTYPEVHFGKSVQLLGIKNTTIGAGSIVGDDAWINVAIRDDQLKIKIGKKVCIGRRSTISAGGYVEIGDYCLLAPNVYIAETNHKYTDVTRSILDQGVTAGRLIMEENCWCGINSVITGNITIGRGSVIGANSVVQKDVPAFSVVAGNPARIIKMYNPQSNQWEKIHIDRDIRRIEDARAAWQIPERQLYAEMIDRNSQFREVSHLSVGNGISI